MRATAKDLRLRTKDVFTALERGEDVVISHRGKDRAKLVPLAGEKTQATRVNPLWGLWRDREDIPNVDHQVRKLRRGRYYE